MHRHARACHVAWLPKCDVVVACDVKISKLLCRSATKAHKGALMAVRGVWALLLHSVIKFENLSAAILAMDSAISAADVVYHAVLQRHSNSSKLIRM